MRKRNYLLIILFLNFFDGFINAQTTDWIVNFGGAYADEGRSIAVDNVGNVYTVGSFSSTVDFDPGEGVYNLTGIDDLFISKLDVNGNFVWAKQVLGAYCSNGRSIAVNSAGELFITGYFFQTVDFNPGIQVHNLTSAGALDAFVLKLDANGNFLWANRLGGAGEDRIEAIFIENDELFITGSFEQVVDFDWGVEVFEMTSISMSDAFILKLNNNGDFQWVKQFGGNSIEAITHSIAVDNNGIYTTGSFSHTIDFDPGPGVYELTSIGDMDIFISKLDTDGNFSWAKSIGSEWYEEAMGIATDQYGDVYVTGFYGALFDFDPGPEVYELPTITYQNLFILKLNSDGDFIWARRGEDTINHMSYDIALDASNNVHVIGFTLNGINPTTSVDVVIYKLNPDGVFVWNHKMGGIYNDYGYSICIGNDGSIYSTGRFQDVMTTESTTLTSNGSSDVFIHKIKPADVSIYTVDVQNLLVYPNPVNDIINIEKMGNVSVLDISGKIVEIETNFSQGKIDVSKLKAGIYFLQIDSGNQLYKAKFIKQ